jgi:hypothetical protein
MDRSPVRITSAGSTLCRGNSGCLLEPTSGTQTTRFARGRGYALRLCTSMPVSCAIEAAKKRDRGIPTPPKRACRPLVGSDLHSHSTRPRLSAGQAFEVGRAPLTCLIISWRSLNGLGCSGSAQACGRPGACQRAVRPRTRWRRYCGLTTLVCRRFAVLMALAAIAVARPVRVPQPGSNRQRLFCG